jgi:hypothetical protein
MHGFAVNIGDGIHPDQACFPGFFSTHVHKLFRPGI